MALLNDVAEKTARGDQMAELKARVNLYNFIQDIGANAYKTILTQGMQLLQGVLQEIQKRFSSRERTVIWLYGPSGHGKTLTLNLLLEQQLKQYGRAITKLETRSQFQPQPIIGDNLFIDDLTMFRMDSTGNKSGLQGKDLVNLFDRQPWQTQSKFTFTVVWPSMVVITSSESPLDLVWKLGDMSIEQNVKYQVVDKNKLPKEANWKSSSESVPQPSELLRRITSLYYVDKDGLKNMFDETDPSSLLYQFFGPNSQTVDMKRPQRPSERDKVNCIWYRIPNPLSDNERRKVFTNNRDQRQMINMAIEAMYDEAKIRAQESSNPAEAVRKRRTALENLFTARNKAKESLESQISMYRLNGDQ